MEHLSTKGLVPGLGAFHHREYTVRAVRALVLGVGSNIAVLLAAPSRLGSVTLITYFSTDGATYLGGDDGDDPAEDEAHEDHEDLVRGHPAHEGAQHGRVRGRGRVRPLPLHVPLLPHTP